MTRVNEFLNDESLQLYLKAVKDFDQAFSDAMAAGYDFTIRIEVRGDEGRVLHIRNHNDGFRRPPNDTNSRKLPTQKG